ncbi:S41 family peptidase [Flavobacterium sp. J49]|uniref:S41 family peptidase n=1 Tax=Flavobacterium sp. J49 TaxID=2718534 RepID=UPI001594773E|nr:S41 family peptidase [Flavobacterium sp. J49]MBF6641253.1 S41 family peptidase [Flavobacterium sp. J49]NIC02500.1 S41 family peptidase [Flavobacterium sp. J49]
MKSKEKYLPLLLFACVALGIIIGGMLNFPKRTLSKQNASKAKIEKLIDFINNEYVDDVDSDSIVDLTVNSILANLDPHSVYIPPSEQSSEAELMKGDFVGIGVNFYMFNDTVTIVKPLANGPAEKAGILAGDRILYADKDKLFGRKLPTDSLFNKLKGEEGSKVLLTIYRKSTNKKLKIPVVRDVVPIKSVDIYLKLNATTGYIKINRFAESTYDEFRVGLEQLKKQGMKTLVIDLRDNGGGYLEKAVEIADELLKDKELIVFTKNKKGEINKTFATEEGIFESGSVFVLIDENSASASEILAGAIQDNDRGTIVGRRSFGKGLVQREMDFEDGSAVRLTTSRYYTPSGRSIQKPYIKGHGEEYSHDYKARFENGELYAKNKIKMADSLKFKTKKGRTVYGGGGIVPDVFVPLEVKKGEESVAYILSSGLVSHFVFEQLDKNRTAFKGVKFDAFLVTMLQDNTIVSKFEKYLKEAGLEMSLTNNKALVKKYLTAEYARQLFGENQYYQIILKDDAMLKAVLK